MAKIPGLIMLQIHYPNKEAKDVAALVGGKVQENYENKDLLSYKDTCAIRISRALNYAGDPIPNVSNIHNPYVGGHVRTNRGADNMRYIYSTYDMRAYLNVRYGQGKKFSPSSTQADLSGVKGIIAFGFYHIDLWDGADCWHQCYFGVQEPKITNDNIIVWQTP
jgi:Type VI secretion system (T6SS), amidase effector protein 4